MKLKTALLATLVSLVVVLAMPESEPEGYVPANVLDVRENTIIIGNNCTAIVAETSPERAYNILLGMEKIVPERPTTHDTIAQILKSFNITVLRLTLDSYDGRYYYSSLYLSGGRKILRLDVMPSDGIAIALRTGAEILINSTLLKEVGVTIC
ncbi:MAG: bifunctional nuclease family protein [Candidatus Micrarchaeota archaeon]|nr:bifunctional nuclease family protein [Candidatus Micrarchaeota archaeon]